MTKNLVTVHIDQVTFKLRETHDFEWLKQLGTVFCVFAEQDSGNLSFGVEKDNVKIFVKYAGAKTEDYEGNTSDAILRLKNAIPIYEDLKHPVLIELINHLKLENGYALVFKWAEGECLHAHWTFSEYNKYTHPKSSYYRYKHLPVSVRLKSLEKLFAFHKHVEDIGYLAVDFYDGSIMYDFQNDITTICDIDFYQKKPFTNKLGEMYWGSPRFKAPEESELNALIDETTNVYTMGAIAFGLLGGETDHSFEKWEANKYLYQVAKLATELDKNKRYRSVSEFYDEWIKFAAM
ncbi:MAG: hypothetical protein ACRCTE_00190 [Cellulosilyticaceae bacterium]